MANRFSYPDLGFGLGLRADHYDAVLKTRPKDVDWFEIISENFLETHRGYWDFLFDLRAHYPIVMHGVSLSIGSADPINRDYLKKLKALADFLNVPWLSDHLCWTGIHGKNTHDLLPVPYTNDVLDHITDRIRQVQDALGRTIIFENPSTYLEFKSSDIPEWEFLARMSEKGDCGLLLDINNIYVSAFNHEYEPKAYIDALPAERIVQIHLAGHRNFGTHIIDTHDDHVTNEVWDLYRYAIKKLGNIPTMVEWDDHIPPLDTLLSELAKARQAATDANKLAA